MKHINYFISLLFIMSSTSFSVIDELSQFQQSLQKIPPFLSATKPITPPPLDPTKVATEVKIADYNEFKTIVRKIHASGDPNKLDRYEQTRAVLIAKTLLEIVLNDQKDPENLTSYQTEYIPLIAQIAENAERSYLGKQSDDFFCAYLDEQGLADNKLLSNELLLLKALRSAGFRRVHLIPMNLWYNNTQKEKLKQIFNNWCSTHKIPIAKTSGDSGVILDLYDNAYAYIKEVIDNKLPQNQLFVMIKSFNVFNVADSAAGLKTIINESDNPDDKNYLNPANILQFTNKEKESLTIYLPSRKESVFIINKIKTEWDVRGDIDLMLLNTPYKQAMLNISDKYFSQLQSISGKVGKDIDLFFCDLIQNTAKKSLSTGFYDFLAFRSLENDPEMKKITTRHDESLREMYERTKR